MPEKTKNMIQELNDKEAIRDCLYYYCRGVDNADEKALRSVYWEDAIDHHGAYQGNAEGFIKNAMQSLKNSIVSIHQISNILIDYKIDYANVESKFHAVQVTPLDGKFNLETMIWGRYADHFEKRNGVWRILKRTVIYDWLVENKIEKINKDQLFKLRKPYGEQFPNDPIYKIFNINSI